MNGLNLEDELRQAYLMRPTVNFKGEPDYWYLTDVHSDKQSETVSYTYVTVDGGVNFERWGMNGNYMQSQTYKVDLDQD